MTMRYNQRLADKLHGNVKMDENAGKRWLSKRGGDIKGMGVGYTMDVTFDQSKVKTLQHHANEKVLRENHSRNISVVTASPQAPMTANQRIKSERSIAERAARKAQLDAIASTHKKVA
jgi:hypothetical protein